MQSQSVVWEISQKINSDSRTGNYSFFIDSEGNPVVVIDGMGSVDTIKSSFIKYDTIGNVLSYKQYISDIRRYPVSFYETDDGYSLFCLTDSARKSTPYEASLPLIINTDKNGDSTSSIEQYNLKLPENYKVFGTKLYSLKTSSISANQNFYNAYIEDKVYLDSTKYSLLNHLIISAYDSHGNFLWRKGYDTLKGSTDIYILRNIKLSKSNTILAVIQYSKRINGKYEHSCKIIETDLDGNLLNIISYSPLNYSVVPADIVSLEYGSIIILGQYSSSTKNNHVLVELNSYGEILKKVDIPLNGVYDNFTGMSLSPSGALVIYGTSIIDAKDPTIVEDDISKMYISKISRDFNLEWQYLWHEHNFGTASSIKNIEFLDENNIIAVGYKDIFDIFCAKISLLPTSVIENKNVDYNFSIYPNPSSDFITIQFSNKELQPFAAEEKVQIFDVLGIEVMSLGTGLDLSTQRIDVSHLPAGVYFIRIGNKVEKFVKM